ncbi:Uncharacterized protein TCM_001038 [Theobroma cacao]|uniref:Uncharacterized protein n=1 Tax=Theobroma cacao TaxID=3641 RepID=A0A061DHN5_THECC|nr:Uncharacterized protein TCM_001038 [Theobroma cacao]
MPLYPEQKHIREKLSAMMPRWSTMVYRTSVTYKDLTKVLQNADNFESENPGEENGVLEPMSSAIKEEMIIDWTLRMVASKSQTSGKGRIANCGSHKDMHGGKDQLEKSIEFGYKLVIMNKQLF